MLQAFFFLLECSVTKVYTKQHLSPFNLFIYFFHFEIVSYSYLFLVNLKKNISGLFHVILNAIRTFHPFLVTFEVEQGARGDGGVGRGNR